MGCCNTNGRIPEDLMFLTKLKDSISADSPDRLRCVLNLMIKHHSGNADLINSPVIDLREISLNPLAYALWTGSLNVFKCLIQEFNASPVEMEKIFQSKGFSALAIICERNFTGLFLYYVPIYMQCSSQIPVVNQDQFLTMNFDSPPEDVQKIVYTPVHKACQLGNISILLTVFNYFKNKDFRPHILDLEYQEEVSGENCVLIACRAGNYAMLKFLHEVVKADFSKCNSKGEGPVLVLLAASRKAPSQVFFQCLVYLAEVVKVDFKNQCEDCLLLAQDRQTVGYLENYLQRMGINLDKQKIEENNKILSAPREMTDLDVKLEEDEEFYIRDYLGDKDFNRSALSSIGNFDSHLEPFMSVLGNNNSILK